MKKVNQKQNTYTIRRFTFNHYNRLLTLFVKLHVHTTSPLFLQVNSRLEQARIAFIEVCF